MRTFRGKKHVVQPQKLFRKPVMSAKPKKARSLWAIFLDTDLYMMPHKSKFPTLKLVFDNLRCYPILALFIAAMQRVDGDTSIVAYLTTLVLGGALYTCAFAVALQTALMMTTISIEATFASFGDPIEDFRRSSKGMAQIFIVLVIGFFVINCVAVIRLTRAVFEILCRFQ